MKRLLMLLVRGYQLLLSPWVGGQCRFTPSCSQYTLQALDRFGAARGSYLGAMRIVRCHPWCRGGDDPVPRLFRWDAWRERDEVPRSEAAQGGDGDDHGGNPGRDSAGSGGA